MLTRCPACQTVFRLRPEQLHARRGEVRCGHCFHPFNALEHALEPWSAYAIMPIFALANAGVAISLATFDMVSPIFLGILAGLCLGKPIGIFGAVFVLCKVFGLQLPGNATKSQLAATGMLGGIGFTMSIFIASLAFTDSAMLDLAKISILSASILSGLLGTAFFKLQACFGGADEKK